MFDYLSIDIDQYKVFVPRFPGNLHCSIGLILFLDYMRTFTSLRYVDSPIAWTPK